MKKMKLQAIDVGLSKLIARYVKKIKTNKEIKTEIEARQSLLLDNFCKCKPANYNPVRAINNIKEYRIVWYKCGKCDKEVKIKQTHL